MSDDKTPPASTKPLSTAEQHAADLGTPAWQFAGLKARHGWPEGKTLTRSEYKDALSAWLDGPTVPEVTHG